MTREHTLAWLAEWQAQFSDIVRTPLDRKTGTLRAAVERYDPRASAGTLPSPTRSSGERLAVYNRQYWFRLFGVLQNEYTLTARLLGFWTFNDWASRFLLAHPPRGWDVAQAAHGFDRFLACELPSAGLYADSSRAHRPRELLLDAVRADAALRSVWNASQESVYVLSPSDTEELADSRLSPSRSVALIEQHWPLLEQRAVLLRDDNASATSFSRLVAPQWWAICRNERGHALLPLASLEARLLLLLRTHQVGEALSMLEAEVPLEQREELPERVQRWLAESVRRGFWVALDRPVQRTPEPRS